MTPTLVTRGDTRLATLSLGPAGTRPLVLLHGLVSGNWSTWYTGIALPLAATRQVLLYDLRGHGDSSVPAGGYDLDSQAADLQAVLDRQVAPEQGVDLAGHSFGALVALHFALAQPHRVRRLVLIDAPMPARQWVAPSLLQADSPAALAGWIASDPALAGAPAGRRRARLLARLETLFFGTSLIADVAAMDAEPEAALRACRLPVQLIYGRRSPCLEAGRRLAALLPSARLTLLDCGHYIPVEAPGELLGLLAATDVEPPPTARVRPSPVPGSGPFTPIFPT